MSFNPLEEKGVPLDDQVRTWSELNVTPYDKREVDPYTRCRVIAMNGIEVEAVLAAAGLCVANAGVVARLAREADDGAARTALQGAAATLEPLARSHQEWAHSMLEQLAVTQAKHPLAQKVGQVAEKVVGKVKDVFT